MHTMLNLYLLSCTASEVVGLDEGVGRSGEVEEQLGAFPG